MGMSASQARLLSLTARLSDLEFQAQSISNSKIRLADESAQASTDYARALDKQKYTVYNAGTDAYVDANYRNLVSYNQKLDINGTNSKFRMIKDNADKLVISEAEAAAIRNYGSEAAYMTAMGVDTTKATYKTTAEYKYYDEIYQAVTSGNYSTIPADKVTDQDYLTSQVAHGNYSLYEYDVNEDTKDAAGNTISKGAFKGVSWDSGDDSVRADDDKRQLAKAEADYNRTMADIQAKDKRFDLQLKQIDTEHTAVQTEIDSVKKVIDKNIERSFKIFNA